MPADLQGLLAVAGCVGDARSQEEYRALLESQGFAVEETQDLRETVESLLKSIKGKMMMGEIAIKLGKLPVDIALFNQAKAIMRQVQDLVGNGTLSYGLILARKLASR